MASTRCFLWALAFAGLAAMLAGCVQRIEPTWERFSEIVEADRLPGVEAVRILPGRAVYLRSRLGLTIMERDGTVIDLRGAMADGKMVHPQGLSEELVVRVGERFYVGEPFLHGGNFRDVNRPESTYFDVTSMDADSVTFYRVQSFPIARMVEDHWQVTSYGDTAAEAHAREAAIQPADAVMTEKEIIAEITALGGTVTTADNGENLTVTSVAFDHDSGSKINDAVLQHIGRLKHLRQFFVWDCAKVTDRGVAALANLHELTRLALSDPAITDAGFAQLKGLTQLRMLMIMGSSVTDAGLANLEGMKQLEELDLPYSTTDAGLEHLKGLRRLRGINLNSSNVGDKGMTTLRALPNLQTLQLNSTRVTDKGLAELAAMPQLRSLMLSATHISDAGVKHLGELTQLAQLSLTETLVTASAIEDLQAALPKCKIFH